MDDTGILRPSAKYIGQGGAPRVGAALPGKTQATIRLLRRNET